MSTAARHFAEHSNFLVGTTKYGQTVFFPDSYLKGYRNVLNRNELWIRLDLFVIGQLSDGSWGFLPSYREGMTDGKNELRFAILAEGQRRLFEEVEAQ